jgi:tRNA/rRNA methyltransferase
MAGTDRTQDPWAGGPAVILVRPQMGENIGAAARAMFNFGLTDLRLTAPRDGWPNEAAFAMAAGAEEVARAARVFDDLPGAMGDLSYVVATTARGRDMAKPVLTPEEAARELRRRHEDGEAVGILFGGERSGLSNDDIAVADAAVTIPANPAFSSLNLGQAVLLIAYEWMKSGAVPDLPQTGRGEAAPATKAELLGLFEHLEQALVRSGFLALEEKRPAMVRNLRAMLTRGQLTDQEVRTLRGIIVSLETYGKPPETPGE